MNNIEYNDLMSIVTSFSNLELNKKIPIIKKKGTFLNLEFDDSKNDYKDFKKSNIFLKKIVVSDLMNQSINEYIMGLMFNFMDLKPQNQTNIYKLINYYEFTLKLNSIPIGLKKEDIIVKIKQINNFLNKILREVILKSDDLVYVDLTRISKLFISKIKMIINFLIKYELNINNVMEFNYILLNMFYMIFYILIKND